MRTEFQPSRAQIHCADGYRHRWAVILAGGDGKRLRPLTRMIAGDDHRDQKVDAALPPKQFCPIVGRETLLDQTRERVRRIIRPEQTLMVVTKPHERFYDDLIGTGSRSQLLVQPFNRGTAPAIAYSLVHLRELDPKGRVVMLPSDHHFADEAAFTADLETAFAAAEIRPDCVMLLGMAPDHPEVGYGWIEPGAPLGGRLSGAIRDVTRFWEKPSALLASSLLKSGCLWNSFVMIGAVDTFLALTRRALPKLMSALESICRPREDAALFGVYSGISSSSFSDDVLSTHANDLAVLCSANPNQPRTLGARP
jgi:mannose-1-phosphate guanylyltransferase